MKTNITNIKTDNNSTNTNKHATKQAKKVFLLKDNQNTIQNNKIYYAIPQLTATDKHNSLRNYEMYVDNYNKNAQELNKNIKQYNKVVAKNIEIQKPKNIKNLQLSFKKTHNTKNVHQYNKLVETANNQNGFLIPKRKIQTIKVNSKIYFETILFFYRLQIEYRNQQIYYNRKDKIILRKIEKLHLNYESMKNHKINGIQKLNGVCKKTIQNHVKRLREANIIQNYNFIDQYTGVFFEINPKIIQISDANPYNIQNINNQLINQKARKLLHNINHTVKKENKTISKKRNQEKIKGKFNSCLADGLQNSSCNYTASEKRKKVPQKKEKNTTISKTLKQNTENLYNLTVQLENKTPQINTISNEILKYESKYGVLSNKEYVEALIQQIMLLAFNKIFKNHKHLPIIYAGIWNKTFKILLKRFTFNKIHYIKKEMAYKVYLRLENAINIASNINNKNQFTKILNPYDWFDPNRKYSHDGGLEFIINKIRLAEKKQNDSNQNFETEYAKKRYQAQKRRTKKLNQRYIEHINQFKAKKITKKQLIELIGKMPKKYLLILNGINK